jgi:hypothetical protein
VQFKLIFYVLIYGFVSLRAKVSTNNLPNLLCSLPVCQFQVACLSKQDCYIRICTSCVHSHFSWCKCSNFISCCFWLVGLTSDSSYCLVLNVWLQTVPIVYRHLYVNECEQQHVDWIYWRKCMHRFVLDFYLLIVVLLFQFCEIWV